MVAVILLLTRRIADAPAEPGVRLDLVGAALSAAGLGLLVFGVLRAGTWGFVNPKPDAPDWLGLSPVFWLVLAGGVVLRIFLGWERSRHDKGVAVLIDPTILGNPWLRAGLTSFFFQYLLQAGMFFAVPLFLSVARPFGRGNRTADTATLGGLAASAICIPKFRPNASPRRVVALGFVAMLAGIVALGASLEVGVGAEVVTWPLLLVGLGIGALASQLGAVTVSTVADEQAAEVGGVQNAVTNLGASIGTALAGAVLISALTASFFAGIQSNPAVPPDLSSRAQVQLSAGVPFVTDEQLSEALADAGVTGPTADAIIKANEAARLDGLRAALATLAVLALAALFFSRRLPKRQPGSEPQPR